jgi:outer membrane protein OmpA-like peptidoglycan-associated protein
MQQYPEYNVLIGGHTDSVGNEEYNRSLSNRRAKNCVNYLVEKGISSSRISADGYGERKPILDNSTNTGREINRRVEFILFVK